MAPRRSDLSIFWPWLQKSTKEVPEGPISLFSGIGSRSRQNGFQEVRFKHFLALAPEVDKMGPGRFDLSTFWHWLQKPTRLCNLHVCLKQPSRVNCLTSAIYALGNRVNHVTSAMYAFGNRVNYVTSAKYALGNRVNYVTSAMYRKPCKLHYFCDVCLRNCLLYTSPSPRDKRQSRMPSSA